MAKTLGTPWQKLGHEVPASELEGVDLYWRASNYLSVGQIYLRSNPLMRPDFVDETTGEVRDFGRPDVKHRLVGHWGTTPGINFLFGHVNRLIADHNQNAIFLMGPGHGGPAGTAQSLNFSFTGEAVAGAASGSASIFSALCSTTSVSFVTLMVWFSSSAAAKGVKAAEARIMLYNTFVFITISVF